MSLVVGEVVSVCFDGVGVSVELFITTLFGDW